MHTRRLLQNLLFVIWALSLPIASVLPGARESFAQEPDRGRPGRAPLPPGPQQQTPPLGVKGVVEGEVIVRFRSQVALSAAQSALQTHGMQRIKQLSQRGVQRVRLPKGMTVQEATQRLGGLAEYVEPNYHLELFEPPTPNDPQFSSLWGLHNTGQSSGTVDADIDAPEAWEDRTNSSAVVVAVIDTGIDYNHPDLAANMWVNPGEVAGNGIDDDGNGYVDDVHGIDCGENDSNPMDVFGHGTHVAGTIGAVGNNGVGVVGVNWSVKLMALKIAADFSLSTADAIECIEYMVMMKTTRGINVRVSNNSWGGASFSTALRDAIAASGATDQLFVASAGNNGGDNDTSPRYPAAYNLPNIIAVAASDRNDNRASFSNYGDLTVHPAAPGVSILSTTPNNTYSTFKGTSMAAPHVTGVAAMVWAHYATSTYAQVKRRILSRVDLKAQWADITLTGGRLNAARAMSFDPTAMLLMVHAPDRQFLAFVGSQVLLRAELISGPNTVTGATVTVTAPGATVTLLDNGVSPDTTANDGVYAAYWTPSDPSSNSLTFRAVKTGLFTVTKVVAGSVRTNPNYAKSAATYQWQDIRLMGMMIEPGDEGRFTFNLPMPIKFYGAEHTRISVSSNGGIGFNGLCLDYTNVSLSNATGAFIAVLWDDWIGAPGASTGRIYLAIMGEEPARKLIVQWDDIQSYPSSPSGVTFQVIIEELTGRMVFQYKDVNCGSAACNNGVSATAGVREASEFLQVSHNEAVHTDGSAVQIVPGGGATGRLRVDMNAFTTIHVNGVPRADQFLLVDVPAGYYHLSFTPLYGRETPTFFLVSRCNPTCGTPSPEPSRNPVLVRAGEVTDVFVRFFRSAG